jgi:hypothetical protein
VTDEAKIVATKTVVIPLMDGDHLNQLPKKIFCSKPVPDDSKTPHRAIATNDSNENRAAKYSDVP